MEDYALVLENVSKKFGDTVAVDCLDAALPAGCIYGFLGPNGAGKTTTLRMVMDIIRPDSGTIRVLGHPAAGRVKDGIGYMPEERGLYRKMTARRVLSFIAGIKGVLPAEVPIAVNHWLRKVGLEDRADSKVEELSRGMQQKLQFAATVVSDPQLVILDEPFSGLDPVNLDLVKEVMSGFRSQGKTVIFSTHMMEQAEKICDYLLLINKGRKVIDGTLEQIRSRYTSDRVLVEAEDPEYLPGKLPGVTEVTRQGRKIELVLAEGGDSQKILQELAGRTR
ncbi:MAG: ATP-binding cassette domain-containing protein, partial [Candidatus Glassbacteria bacterium]